jgi:hypothetical protein
MVRLNGPSGLFMTNSCSIYGAVNPQKVFGFCLNFAAKLIGISWNEWMNGLFGPTNTKEMSITKQNNSTLSVRCAFQYLFEFFFSLFSFLAKGIDDNVVLVFKIEKNLKWNIYSGHGLGLSTIEVQVS